MNIIALAAQASRNKNAPLTPRLIVKLGMLMMLAITLSFLGGFAAFVMLIVKLMTVTSVSYLFIVSLLAAPVAVAILSGIGIMLLVKYGNQVWY